MRGWTLILLAVASCGDKGTDPGRTYAPTPFVLNTPAGFPPPEIPPDNALTHEGIELGRRLFSDPILSADSTVACATCHLPSQAFSDPRPFSRGVDGLTGRNSMPIFNVLWRPALFWDGRAPSLEEQALAPVRDPRNTVNCLTYLQHTGCQSVYGHFLALFIVFKPYFNQH